MSKLKVITAQEAAALINHGDIVGFSGFTAAGTPKIVPVAIAERAKAIHAEGKPFKIGIITGASTGASVDGALAKAEAILFRTPYQSNADLRKSINTGKTHFFDMHLSTVAQSLRYGSLGKLRVAIIEACEVTEDGKIYPTTALGIAPTACNLADIVIIELNANQPKGLMGMCDCYEPKDPPHRREIPVYKPSDRIGTPYIQVDPKKIAGVVNTAVDDETGGFDEATDVTKQIGENVANFLANELKCGRIPSTFLPIQSGVGNIANAVLGAMGTNPGIPSFQMYTEVIQDSVIGLLKSGKISFASGVSLTISPDARKEVFSNLAFYKDKVMLRPQEIANNPEVVRRLGLITINTAIEVDVFGNVNSTHVMGKQLMNGIGGSGDFTRNGFMSVFTCPSTAKGGLISAIVPRVSHNDHSEHSVQIVVTEQGVADLRGKSPRQRAELIIEKCAHPDYRPLLREYIRRAGDSHMPDTLSAAFGMHMAFMKQGDMRKVIWDNCFA